MADITINVSDNGPYLMTGPLLIRDRAGIVAEQQKAALCRCGSSANKPFCDGSHVPAGFESMVRAAG
jgi:CDGSH-type Zn-finger protein